MSSKSPTRAPAESNRQNKKSSKTGNKGTCKHPMSMQLYYTSSVLEIFLSVFLESHNYWLQHTTYRILLCPTEHVLMHSIQFGVFFVQVEVVKRVVMVAVRKRAVLPVEVVIPVRVGRGRRGQAMTSNRRKRESRQNPYQVC